MAITPRASSTLALATRTNSTVTRPTGTTTGDYVVVALDAGGSSAATITGPAGWTQLGTVTYSDTDPWFVVLQIWGRFDDGGGSWTWTHASRSTQAFATAYMGVHATTPIDVTATTADGAGTTIVAPSQAIVTAGARGVIARGSWDGSAITPPAGWNERLDTPVLWVGDRDWASAGATGTVTVSSGNAILLKCGIIMAALRPAGSTPNTGSATGAFTFTGAATGKRIPKGSGAGSFAFTGAATGKRIPKGSGAGSFTFDGGAAGDRSSFGVTAGTYGWVGAANGGRSSSGSAIGGHAWTGVADGEMRPTGSGTGDWGFDGLADGSRLSIGTAAGGWSFEGLASGVTPPVPGSGGVAFGTWSFAGSADGSRTSSGEASGSWLFAGAASGEAPGVPGAGGSAAGAWAFTGAADGSRSSSGSALGAFSWAGVAIGVNGEVAGLLVYWLEGGVVRSGRWWVGTEAGGEPVTAVLRG